MAERLAPLDEAAQARVIATLDGDALKLGRLVRYPGLIGGVVTKIVRLGERGTVPRII